MDHVVCEKDHRDTSQGHVTLSKFDFSSYRTHKEEQGLSSMLELVNLANLDDKAKPSRHLTYRL